MLADADLELEEAYRQLDKTPFSSEATTDTPFWEEKVLRALKEKRVYNSPNEDALRVSIRDIKC